MAITLVQHAQKDVSSAVASTTLAYGSNVTVNNLLIVVVRGGSALTSITITDSIGNSFTNGTFHAVGGIGSLQITFAVNISTSANTVTITPNASSTLRIAIFEYSGTVTTSPLDAENNAATNTSTTPAANSITPGADNELVFGSVATGNNFSETWTPGTNFTAEEQVGTFKILATEDWIQTTATATTAPQTMGTSDSWLAAIAVFKAATASNIIYEDDSFNPGLNAFLVQSFEPVISVW